MSRCEVPARGAERTLITPVFRRLTLRSATGTAPNPYRPLVPTMAMRERVCSHASLGSNLTSAGSGQSSQQLPARGIEFLQVRLGLGLDVAADERFGAASAEGHPFAVGQEKFV